MSEINSEVKISKIADGVLQQASQWRQPTVLLGIGMPASGKSTILEEIAYQHSPSTRPISIDAIRNRLIILGSGKSIYSLLQNETEKQVVDAFRGSKLALIDGTNVETEKRKLDIERYRKLGARAVAGIFMDTSLQEALERNAAREVPLKPTCIKQMGKILLKEPPTLDEGFDWLLTVSPKGSYFDLLIEGNELRLNQTF